MLTLFRVWVSRSPRFYHYISGYFCGCHSSSTVATFDKPFSELRTKMDEPSSSGSVPASTGEVSLIYLAIVQPALPSPQALSFGGTRRRKVFDHFHRGQHDFLKKRLQAACGILFGERYDLSGKLCQIERCVEIPIDNETAEQTYMRSERSISSFT
jgi:hypothetical protein